MIKQISHIKSSKFTKNKPSVWEKQVTKFYYLPISLELKINDIDVVSFASFWIV